MRVRSNSDPILWGRGDSTNVQKVIWACHELGLVTQRQVVGGRYGRTEDPGFAGLNPNRTVPVWQAGDEALWESQAILRHLARTEGRLYGRTPRETALVDQWLDWFATVFWPPVRTLFLEARRDQAYEVGDRTTEASAERVRRSLSILDARLDGRTWLASEDFSVADIVLAIGLNRLTGIDLPIDLPPSVTAFLERARARNGFAVATADEPDMPGHRNRNSLAKP